MNLETLAIETQGQFTIQEVVTNMEQTAEITSISTDCFKLVGGGSSIVLFD